MFYVNFNISNVWGYTNVYKERCTENQYIQYAFTFLNHKVKCHVIYSMNTNIKMENNKYQFSEMKSLVINDN